MSKYRTPVKWDLELIRDIHRYRVISGKKFRRSTAPQLARLLLKPISKTKNSLKNQTTEKEKTWNPPNLQKESCWNASEIPSAWNNTPVQQKRPIPAGSRASSCSTTKDTLRPWIPQRSNNTWPTLRCKKMSLPQPKTPHTGAHLHPTSTSFEFLGWHRVTERNHSKKFSKKNTQLHDTKTTITPPHPPPLKKDSRPLLSATPTRLLTYKKEHHRTSQPHRCHPSSHNIALVRIVFFIWRPYLFWMTIAFRTTQCAEIDCLYEKSGLNGISVDLPSTPAWGLFNPRPHNAHALFVFRLRRCLKVWLQPTQESLVCWFVFACRRGVFGFLLVGKGESHHYDDASFVCVDLSSK